MNIFVSRDLQYTELVIHRLEKDLTRLQLNSNVTLLTTDREQDKPFVSFALMKGLNFKVYNVKDFATEEVAKKIANNIDYLILYTRMSNEFYRSLFKFCSNTVIIEDKRYYLNELRTVLVESYNNKVESIKSDKRRKKPIQIDEYKLYKEMVLDTIKDVEKIPIKIFDNMEW